MDRRQYRNPPIEEALCEVRFVPDPNWNVTLIGALRERLKDSYPGQPLEQVTLELGMEVDTGRELSPRPPYPALSLTHGLSKVQLPTESGDRLVAIGRDVLSVHVLRPYAGWEDFRPRIEQALEAYAEVIPPAGIMRIGLRYINRVRITASTVHLDEYFTEPPRIPSGLPATMTGVFSRIEVSFQDAPVRLVSTFATATASEGEAAFLLDLDVSRESIDPQVTLDNIMTIVDELHYREHQAFECMLTDRLREVFDAP
jgi:uncharacterized protein (TIGR04255 family)